MNKNAMTIHSALSKVSSINFINKFILHYYPENPVFSLYI